ncbi:hypothetical protein PENNAL_c0527G11149 [Penicillium nalgiovense]|uniref:Uncharacterized protein n=1 Tax=Penicillium nalgiovense TaxID=60175 RepID=A0A1V6VI72_PENNA|nr:hypothetical protein PENNAL_c0527G11149 [Penicillium nalgiovense]
MSLGRNSSTMEQLPR